MKSFAFPFLLAIGIAAAVPGVGAAPATPTAPAPAAPKLHTALRALWQGHVQHTRAYAMALKTNDSKAATRAADDVVANAKEIAGAVASFYGAPAGEKMLALLAGHLGCREGTHRCAPRQ
jgi:hypothetical protein